MGYSRKYRQQWEDLDRTEAAAKLRELADHIEQDTLVFAGEVAPLATLKRVKIALQPVGDRVTVVQNLKGHRDQVPGAALAPPTDKAAPRPAPPATAQLPPVDQLSWKPLKRTLKQLYRELFVTFRQGRLPAISAVQWLRDASARQRSLRDPDDPMFVRFEEIADELLTAVMQSEPDRARAAWQRLCDQHRACHRSRK